MTAAAAAVVGDVFVQSDISKRRDSQGPDCVKERQRKLYKAAVGTAMVT